MVISKTVIVSISIVTAGECFVGYCFIVYLRQQPYKESELVDLQPCIDRVMTKSIDAGRLIDAENAKEICVNIERGFN